MDDMDMVHEMTRFLSDFDVSSTAAVPSPKTTFSYERGSNEGCYMTIGKVCYRCMISRGSREMYRKAVIHYLSMISFEGEDC